MIKEKNLFDIFIFFKKAKVFYIILTLLVLFVFSSNIPEIPEKQVKAQLQLIIGSDKINEDFFRPEYFFVDQQGNIYVLDSGNSRIQCFSSSGKFKFSFGRFGQGPGEMSKYASKLKLLEDKKLYLIDNYHRRITIFSLRGEYHDSYKLPFPVDDITLKNGKYYLSTFILKEKYEPIKFTSDLKKIEGSFGEIIEPTPRLIEKVQSAPLSILLENEFARMNMTRIVVNSREEIIYSQRWPYYLAKYNRKGKLLKEVYGKTDFDSHFPLEIKVEGESVSRRVTAPTSDLFDIILTKDDKLVVPFINPKRTIIFIDFFDSALNLIKRYKLANKIYDWSKPAGIKHLFINQNNKMYCLIVSREDLPKLKIFRLVEQ